MFETAQPQADTANQPEAIEVNEAAESQTCEEVSGQNEPQETGNEGVQGEPFMTVRYNKEDMPLSKEEAVVYAQKGMNYDKLNERLKDLSARLSEYENGPIEESESGTEEEKQALIDSQLDDFMRENPGTDPRSLPENVIGDWKKGTPLTQAFLKHQTAELSQRLLGMKEEAAKNEVNRKNEAASMGKAIEGASRVKSINEDSIRSMSSEELDRNHDRIWAYLTGK